MGVRSSVDGPKAGLAGHRTGGHCAEFVTEEPSAGGHGRQGSWATLGRAGPALFVFVAET